MLIKYLGYGLDYFIGIGATTFGVGMYYYGYAANISWW
jgi:hypothetical protein